uniref:NFD4 C-terminal domain-containing protein n=1 Tax=Aegilops tauschii subsp. strangulata TaxID=200361 RepID=A0A453M3X3_AEGTS
GARRRRCGRWRRRGSRGRWCWGAGSWCSPACSSSLRLRGHLHLRPLLQGAQVGAGLRPADPQHLRLLQGPRRQRRRPLRPHQRGHAALGRARHRRRHEPRRLPHDLPRHRRPHGPPARLAHVRLHLRRRQLAVLHQHRRARHLRQELPGEPRRRAGPAQGLRGAQRRHLHPALHRHLRRRRQVARAARRVAPRRRLHRLRPHGAHHAAPPRPAPRRRGDGRHHQRPLLLLPLHLHGARHLPARHDRGAEPAGALAPGPRRVRHRAHAHPPPPPRRRRQAGVQDQPAAQLQMAAKTETKTEDATSAPTAASPSSSSCFGSSCLKEMFSPPAQGEDYTILQALVSVDMLVLFLATICGVGGTLTAIDNMGQIGQSLGYPPKSIKTFISLISIWNYAGRVTAGFASEAVLARYKFPRPLMLTLVLLLACVGHLLIAFGVPQSLYAASVVIGFCFGAQWPLLFAIISELFGLKYYSTLYNFGSVASPIGAYALNVRVAGYLYDVEAARQHGGTLDGAGDKTCVGVQCFKLAFLIITAATVAGALVSLLLVWRTRKFYRSDIYAKFRDAADGEPRKEAESSAVNGSKE